MLRATDMNIGL